MALLPTSFQKARSNVEPSADDLDKAPKCHKAVREDLEGAPELQDLGIDTVLIGSYKRQVSIRRVKDVDVFCKLPNLDPQMSAPDLLALFGEVLASKYAGRLHPQARSWTIDGFSGTDLHVDVVPARVCGDHWEIPQDGGGWEETNPEKLGVLTTKLNEDHDELYVPTVKLVRQVRRIALGADTPPGGLYLEILTHQAFRDGLVDASSQDAALTTALRGIASGLAGACVSGLDDVTLPGKTIQTKATPEQLAKAKRIFEELATVAEEALNTIDKCKAARIWQEMLGDIAGTNDPVFPLPDDCGGNGGTVLPVGERAVGGPSRRYS